MVNNIKKIGLIFIFVFGTYSFAGAQSAPQTDTKGEEIQRQRDAFNKRVDNLRNLDKAIIREDLDKNSSVYLTKIKPLYRIPTEQELSLVAPSATDLQKYASFLRSSNTGIISLIADENCSAEFGVVVSTPHCLKYSMPGAASSYSFRMDSYRQRDLSDINFNGANFQTSFGTLTHGIMVNIGDVPIEKVDSQNPALAILSGFSPVTDFAKASNFAALLEKGINAGNLVFANTLPVKLNNTYILRSIAYRGELLRSVEGVIYNEFDLDKRKDTIVVFRVINHPSTENITVLYKQISIKDAPKMKM